MAVPVDAVRFTQKIASTKGTDQEDIEELIKEIADWLKKYTSTGSTGFAMKVLRYNFFPTLKLLILHFFGFKKYVERRIDHLLATKEHPEYRKESAEMSVFLQTLLNEAMIKIKKEKEHPKDLELPTLDVMRCAMAEHEVLVIEEDKLFESSSDEKGIKHHDSVCFHCRKMVHLETDPNDDDVYLISEYEEEETE